MTKNILLIEDEPGIADNVVYALQLENFKVTWLTEGLAGLAALNQNKFDIVVLDVGLPDISGFEVCKDIRKQSDIPIIFLTARGDEIDRIVGFEIGGDDYLVKPFSPRELVARVKVIIRRSQNSAPQIHHADKSFTVDNDKRKVIYCNHLLDLTTYEYGILTFLLKNPERVYSREQLMNAVWPSPDESFERAVDTHIKTLRAKLKKANPDDDSLVTHRGIGYSIKLL